MATENVQEVLRHCGPFCATCGDTATRRVAPLPGYREWIFTCGPFREITRIPIMLADSAMPSDMNRLEETPCDRKRRWHEALCGVPEIKPFVEYQAVTIDDNPSVGPHYCDKCSPPGKVMEDLGIAKLVRSLIDPRLRTSSGQLVFPDQA